jgi:hypothetical protein
MPVAPSADSAQGWVAATLETAAAAGQQIAVLDADGEVVLAYVLPQATSDVVVSSAAIVAGQAYTIAVGDAGDATGLTTGGSGDGLTEAASVTANEFSGSGSGGFGGHGTPPEGQAPNGQAPGDDQQT